LDGTQVTKSAEKCTRVTALINLLTPFFTCFLYSIPLLIALTGVIDVRTGAISSIAVALTTLMITGIVMNKNGKGNPVFKGIKMAGLGGVTFLLGYVVQLVL
jgi:VIT1/CCC1 family predicted Fe2+/Mn2+ transporter